ncbi:S-layer homology domain-containing protein [Paenibacillus sp. 1P07SE]|uniref:S-layer homology domain-containing protein n=1 Tax=Paenibacillus sp. 1P07SE TaxID=3132209 RepID=UPI0039A50BFA
MKKLKHGTAILMTLTMLFLSILPGLGGQTAAAAVITSPDAHYLAGSGPALAAPNIDIDGSADPQHYSEITFGIDGALADEQLTLLEVAAPEALDVTAGAVSVFAGIIYLGDGTATKAIGEVNETLDGSGGKTLQIDFYSRPLTNGDFNDGITTGWQVNDALVNLGDLATKTQGRPVTASPNGDGSFTITGDGYSYISDIQYTHEGEERPLSSGGSFTSSISVDNGNSALQLTFANGTVSGTSHVHPYGSVFGPEAISDMFDATAGDSLAFDWKAAAGQDDYEIYGFLIQSGSDDPLEILYSRGKDRDWTTSYGKIPADGDFQFRFVAGSYDQSGGLQLGASLEIDNIRVYGQDVSDEVIEQLARLVTYEKPDTDGLNLDADNPTADRTLNITAYNTSGTTSSGEATIVIEDQLRLLTANVDDTRPDQVELTFNLPLNSDPDSINLEGLTVGGQSVARILSVDGNVVVAELAGALTGPEAPTTPVTPGLYPVVYEPTENSNVESGSNSANKLQPVPAAPGEGAIDASFTITPLELIKVTTDPADPHAVKLQFNKDLSDAEDMDLTGLTIGGKQVQSFTVDGDTITVQLEEPYESGDQLAYDDVDPSLITGAAYPELNILGEIEAGDIAILDGKLDGLELSTGDGALILEPDFDTDVNSYRTAVPQDTETFRLSPGNANTPGTGIKVSLNGEEVDGAPDSWENLPLEEGPNEITVTAFDEETGEPLNEYTITVWRASSKLVELNPSAGHLSPAFDSETEDYTMTVGNGTSQINWTPVALDPESTIEISVNNGPFAEVASGDASGNLALNVGNNTVVVKVTDRFDGTTKEYTVTVTRANANSGIYYPPVTPPASNKQTIPVDVVIGGDAGADITKIDIERTTHEDGRVTDLVTFTPDKAQEAVRKAAAAGEQIARIVIPATQAQADELQVDVPGTSLRTLQGNGIDLEIFTPHAALQVPNHSLDELDGDLYFRLVPVKDAAALEAIAAGARADQAVRQAANGNPIDVIGRPVTIETNMPSREAGLILPLHAADLPQDAEARQAFLEGLRVYADYEDGSKALVDAEVITLADGTLGLRLATDQFGTFTVLQLGDRTPGQEADGYHTAYIDGYTDGTFGPNRSATRAELAAMLDKLGAVTETASSGSGFPDVAASHWAARSIGKVTATGLMSGYPNGQFQPSGSITRAEMAVIAYNYLELSEVSGTGSFSDVGASHWAYGIVEAVQASGLMTGYADGTFKPSQQLTRAEAVTILNRMFNRGPLYGGTGPRWSDVPEGHWAYYDIDEASSNHAYALRPEGGEQWVGH